jgi:anti-anti-sigma factor
MAEAVLTTQIENRDGIQLVHVSGPLDSMTHDQFKELLDPMVNQSHVRIVLDCTNLTYVNSKGLALLGRYQRVSLQNLSFLGIAALNRRITKTIELLGMSKLVKLYPTVEEAMQSASVL